MKRWEMMLTDLHYVGAMLNPYLRGHMELQQNGEAKRALNRMFRRLSNPLGVGFNEVMAEMTEYEKRLGPYSLEEASDIRVANLQPHQWWSKVGGEALPKIASEFLLSRARHLRASAIGVCILLCTTKAEIVLAQRRQRIWCTFTRIRGFSEVDWGQILFDGMRTMCSRRMKTRVWMTTQTQMMEMMMII